MILNRDVFVDIYRPMNVEEKWRHRTRLPSSAMTRRSGRQESGTSCSGIKGVVSENWRRFFWCARAVWLRLWSKDSRVKTICIYLSNISSLLFKCFPNSKFRNWTFWFHEIHFIKNPYWVNIFLKVQFWPDSIERFSERIFNWFVGSCQWVILGTLNNNIDGGSAKILCKYSANILEPNYLNI